MRPALKNAEKERTAEVHEPLESYQGLQYLRPKNPALTVAVVPMAAISVPFPLNSLLLR